MYYLYLKYAVFLWTESKQDTCRYEFQFLSAAVYLFLADKYTNTNKEPAEVCITFSCPRVSLLV